MTRMLIALALATSIAAAQNYFDDLSYPAGTLVPGYTEQRGDWMCTGTGVQAQPTSTFQELTFDGITDGASACEILAAYDTAVPGLQYVGPMLRHSGSGASATYFMVKVQDNASPYTGWDQVFAYWYNGSSFQGVGITPAINPPTTLARIRLQVFEETIGTVRVTVEIDTDLDGIWNISQESTTSLGAGSSGNFGVCGYNRGIAEEIRYFSGTLRRTSTPAIGSPLVLAGRAQPGLFYMGACSTGHQGFIAVNAIVPLDPDPLFFLSLQGGPIFQDFTGLVQPDESFNMTLNIPPIPSLAGATLWAAAITTDGSSVLDVMPDTEIRL